MPTAEYFGSSYADARARFRSAAIDAGARLQEFRHPTERGPDGGDLTIDVASIGPRDATRCLLLISGTHGVEGFGGSGCQVGFFRDNLGASLPPDASAVVVHALNPYGFAWLRRVNEDNIDLNRNFRDFERPIVTNPDYATLHGALIPVQWEGPERATADLALQSFIAQRGTAAFQAALTVGQYTHQNGLFYGGVAATWSASTFVTLLRTCLPPALKRLIAIDLHTGLGRCGYGEPIFIGESPEHFERAQAIFGPEVKDLSSGGSVSSPVVGTLANPVLSFSRDCEALFLALEFGTKPLAEVLTALRGDHWLYATGFNEAPLAPRLKQALRDAFYIEAPYWQTAMYGRVADFVQRAISGLS